MSVSQHIISILVENKFGVSVGSSVEPSTSQITVVTKGDERIIEQITKQLNKLIDVIKVVDLAGKDYIVRETALIKINTSRAEDRSEALRITEIFRARVVDSTPVTYTVEITGDENKIDAIINLLRPLGIKEIVRTGKIAIAREDVKVPAVLEVKRVRA